MSAAGGLSITELAEKVYRVVVILLPVISYAHTRAQMKSFKANATGPGFRFVNF